MGKHSANNLLKIEKTVTRRFLPAEDASPPEYLGYKLRRFSAMKNQLTVPYASL
jgi:predicted SPOUT superfamily RNA methylase MTH1